MCYLSQICGNIIVGFATVFDIIKYIYQIMHGRVKKLNTILKFAVGRTLHLSRIL